MPLDLELFDEITAGQNFFRPLTKDPYVLVDAEHGIAPYRPENPHWANVAFARMEVERLQADYAELRINRNRYYSIGAVRMARVLPTILERPSPDAITVVQASTRAELDRFLDMLRTRLGQGGTHQLWLRGQPDDYLTENFTSPAKAGICGWRAVRDSSLVPSLYRELLTRIDNPKAYARYCYEYALYSTFLEVDLGLVNHRARELGEEPSEPIRGPWMRNVLNPTFVTRSDGSIEMYSRAHASGYEAGAQQVRDYDPVFYGLQKIFFMQHYGLQSNVLDITRDLDVALFFAQNEFRRGTVAPIDVAKHQPTLYVFLLRDDLDKVLDSSALAEHYGLLRPQRQKCGLLFGASMIHRNDYARFISLKIVLNRPIAYRARVHDLIPPVSEDGFLGRLVDFANRNGMIHIRPWVCET